MDIYDFLDYFREKYDLRENIIYNDDSAIVCSVLGYDSSTIVSIRQQYISIDEANQYCETIRKYIDTHSDVDIFELYKNNCSVQNYYDYLKYRQSLQANNPFRIQLELKHIHKHAPVGINQEVYEEAMTKFLVDYGYLENEVKTVVFGYKNKFPTDYEELCILTEMTNLGTKYGLSSIAYRTKMSYGEGFKYYQVFTVSSKLLKLIKNKFPEISSDVKKVWTYDKDSNILLINMPGYNFLTTVDMLINDLNITKTEFEQMVN